MIKKALKFTVFSTFVLLLFSSCVKKVEDCKILPKITVDIEENSESTNKKLQIAKREAHFTCNF